MNYLKRKQGIIIVLLMVVVFNIVSAPKDAIANSEYSGWKKAYYDFLVDYTRMYPDMNNKFIKSGDYGNPDFVNSKRMNIKGVENLHSVEGLNPLYYKWENVKIMNVTGSDIPEIVIETGGKYSEHNEYIGSGGGYDNDVEIYKYVDGRVKRIFNTNKDSLGIYYKQNKVNADIIIMPVGRYHFFPLEVGNLVWDQSSGNMKYVLNKKLTNMFKQTTHDGDKFSLATFKELKNNGYTRFGDGSTHGVETLMIKDINGIRSHYITYISESEVKKMLSKFPNPVAKNTNEIVVLVNNKLVDFKKTHNGQPLGNPEVKNNRTSIPLRAVAEGGLGYTIDWENKTQTAVVKSGSTTIRLKIGESSALVNGKKILIDSPAYLKGGRTYVPARFIAEAMGDVVDFKQEKNGNKTTSTVIISTTNKIVDKPMEKPIDMSKVKTEVQNIVDEALGIRGINKASPVGEKDILRYFSQYMFSTNEKIGVLEHYQKGATSWNVIPKDSVNKYALKYFGREIVGDNHKNKGEIDNGWLEYHYSNEKYYFGFNPIGMRPETSYVVTSIAQVNAGTITAKINEVILDGMGETVKGSYSIELEKKDNRYVIKNIK